MHELLFQMRENDYYIIVMNRCTANIWICVKPQATCEHRTTLWPWQGKRKKKQKTLSTKILTTNYKKNNWNTILYSFLPEKFFARQRYWQQQQSLNNLIILFDVFSSGLAKANVQFQQIF